MPRTLPWLSLCVLLAACDLSVDEPPEEPSTAPSTPPTGNPFLTSRSGGGAGYAGRGADDEQPTATGGEGGVGGSSVAEGCCAAGGERLTPIGVLGPSDAPDAGCAADAGACEEHEPICVSNDDCGDGLCVNARCRAFCDVDADCAEGEACALGLCRANPGGTWECLDADDCTAGEDCVSGSCLWRCSSDEHCVGADDGPVCSYGFCGL